MATYNEAEELINIGAYKAGSNPEIDYAISKIQAVNTFLMQGTDEKFSFDEEVRLLFEIFGEVPQIDEEEPEEPAFQPEPEYEEVPQEEYQEAPQEEYVEETDTE
jgi:hypothetical protein